MTQVTVKSFPEKSPELAAALADQIVAIQNSAFAKRPEHRAFYVAVSGGSLVATLRKALLPRTDIDWANWHIYFADERIVPLDDHDSNYGLLKKELLDHLPADQAHPTVVPIDPTLDTPAAVAESYESSLRSSVPSTVSSFPALDLVLLGCGPDGHTASLFPGHPLLLASDTTQKAVDYLTDSPKPPPSRVTLTLPVLAQTGAQVVFVAEGAAKGPVLKQILDDKSKEYDGTLPCARVNTAADGRVTWYVSETAFKI